MLLVGNHGKTPNALVYNQLTIQHLTPESGLTTRHVASMDPTWIPHAAALVEVL